MHTERPRNGREGHPVGLGRQSAEHSLQGSVANFDFRGKMRKPALVNSMTYRRQNSRKSNFATEPDGVGEDQAVGDGIYAGQWTPDAVGTFTLTFPSNNSVTVIVR